MEGDLMKLGFIVNPIAGMGGRVGLKGTDGKGTLEKALSLGAVPESPIKAKKALEVLIPHKEEIEIYTYPGKMGEDEAVALGFDTIVLGEKGKETFFPNDTEDAAKAMAQNKVDIILFAGGDVTARNIYNAIGDDVPVIGIPAGVKIHSAVYASHPRAAGEVVRKWLMGEIEETKLAEVMDIDEEAFREGVVSARLYGYMNIPVEPELIQTTKSPSIAAEEDALDGIADRIVEEIEENPDTFFIMGSGTTIRPIMGKMDLPNTLLGIDIVKNKELIASDVNEKEILDIIGDEEAKIVVTVIGGQGYIFGRGNQQISGKIIKRVGKKNIIIAAPKNKLMLLEGRPLLVDTGMDEVNKMFTGYIKVYTTYYAEAIEKIKGL
jgi:predicted polyphosphate/ATP-dependent NAD kinase